MRKVHGVSTQSLPLEIQKHNRINVTFMLKQTRIKISAQPLPPLSLSFPFYEMNKASYNLNGYMCLFGGLNETENN